MGRRRRQRPPPSLGGSLLRLSGALGSAAADCSVGAGAACPAGRGGAHHWPHARGREGRYSTASFAGPRNLSASLLWSWHHPEGRYRTIVPGAPLIDGDGNIYLSAVDGIRKFGPDGTVLWTYRPDPSVQEEQLFAVPSLWGDSLFACTREARLFSLDLSSGRERWSRRHAERATWDASYVEAIDGMVLAAVDGHGPMTDEYGNRRVIAVNASTGDLAWEYRVGASLWNFMPLSPGDGTVVFTDMTGGVYRLDLRSGVPLWHSPAPEAASGSWTDGGVILGPNGTAISCSNMRTGEAGSAGALRAYALADGRRLWEQELPRPCTSWPAVAADGSAVVVPVGHNPGVLPPSLLELPPFLPLLTKVVVHLVTSRLSPALRRRLWGNPQLEAEVLAFDPRTGDRLWRFAATPWEGYMARGDEEGFLTRMAIFGLPRAMCGPASWSAPTLDASGAAFLGHAGGLLYALRDADGDGRVEGPEEVSSFDAGAAFMPAGASFAPGFMAIASCDGLFVFRH